MKKERIEVKKFNNGNITLYNSDWNKNLICKYIDGVLFWDDLYFNQVNGYIYLMDFNTGRVYDMGIVKPYLFESLGIIEALKILFEEGKGKVVLYPMPKREAKSILEDMENGY